MKNYKQYPFFCIWIVLFGRSYFYYLFFHHCSDCFTDIVVKICKPMDMNKGLKNKI